MQFAFSVRSVNALQTHQGGPVLIPFVISRTCMLSLQKLLLERVGKTSWEKREVVNQLFVFIIEDLLVA